MKGDGNGKDKALETTLANLRKRYGDGAIMKLGEAADMRVEAIPTGALSLDLALGVGGLPVSYTHLGLACNITSCHGCCS